MDTIRIVVVITGLSIASIYFIVALYFEFEKRRKSKSVENSITEKQIKEIAKELKLIRKELEKTNRHSRVRLFMADEYILNEAIEKEKQFNAEDVAVYGKVE